MNKANESKQLSDRWYWYWIKKKHTKNIIKYAKLVLSISYESVSKKFTNIQEASGN